MLSATELGVGSPEVLESFVARSAVSASIFRSKSATRSVVFLFLRRGMDCIMHWRRALMQSLQALPNASSISQRVFIRRQAKQALLDLAFFVFGADAS